MSGGLLWDRRNDPLAPVRGTLTTADVEIAARALGSEVGYDKVFLQSSVFRALRTSRRLVLGLRGELGLAHGFPLTTAEGSVRNADIPASQRFYSGGSTTVRGFQNDRLGVPEIITPNGLSLGGNGLVVVNAELRTTLGKLKKGDFGIVAFTDGGNVFARASDIDLARIRGSYGAGVRWDSPIGPLRLDFGFKMDRHVINGQRERLGEWHLNIGEAF